MNAPSTEKELVSEEIFGHTINDPYRWLEDTESSEVKSWLDTQDTYARSILKDLPQREELRGEFDKLYREETLGFPRPCQGRYFFMKRKADEDQHALYFQEGLHGEPRVLVDPNKISKEKGYPVSLADYSISKDGKFITYRISETSNDQKALCVMDVDTGKVLEDKIPAELYPAGASWSIDNKGFWYTRRKEQVPKGEEKFHYRVYYHVLGALYSDDVLVYGEELVKEDRPYATATYDGRFLILDVHISSEKYCRSELYIRNLQNGQQEFKPIVQNVKDDADIYFSGIVRHDFFYIETNYKAPKGKILRVSLADLEKGMDAWQTIIPEQEDRIINSFSIISDKLFVLTMENVHSILREYSLAGDFKRLVEFPTLGTCSGVGGEAEGREAFFLLIHLPTRM